jgi:hypothetical protein
VRKKSNLVYTCNRNSFQFLGFLKTKSGSVFESGITLTKLPRAGFNIPG